MEGRNDSGFSLLVFSLTVSVAAGLVLIRRDEIVLGSFSGRELPLSGGEVRVGCLQAKPHRNS